jgi:hypothetical protein
MKLCTQEKLLASQHIEYCDEHDEDHLMCTEELWVPLSVCEKQMDGHEDIINLSVREKDEIGNHFHMEKHEY